MKKCFIFSIDAMFAALIVIIFLSFFNLHYHEIFKDRLLYNSASSSLLIINDALLSEEESVIDSIINTTLPYFASYSYEIKYYYANLNLRKEILGGNVSNTDVIVVNKMFWSNEGPAFITLKVGYND